MDSTPEKDLQDLLRLLTTTGKLPILQAMGRVKALQTANLRSIRQIAEAAPADVAAAVQDAAAAKGLQTSCRAAVKKLDRGESVGRKRPAEDGATPSKTLKRARPAAADVYAQAAMTPAELEQTLDLPVETDEATLAATVLVTNRAPLVLAFAVELLRYTMPEQPPSSRLSLAQAVVSANSRTRAATLGLAGATGPSAEEDGWGEGQPRVRILGRDVAVLKRGGYTWRGEEEEQGSAVEVEVEEPETAPPAEQHPPSVAPVPQTSFAPSASSAPSTARWSVSPTISLRGSTFVARATTMTSAGQRAGLMRALMAAHPSLLSATHNAWAYRVRGAGSDLSSAVRQDGYDDGETGCGDFMLRVLAELRGVDVLVVLTRWYGGTMLGPDRWRLMRNCVTGAMAERLRRTGAEVALGGEALWGLDLEAMRDASTGKPMANRNYGPTSRLTAVVGMATHRPEAARQYLLKSFAAAADDGGGSSSSSTTKTKKKTTRALEAERADHVTRLLGALRLLYDSWADHLTAVELDRRAWSWYVAVRPDVDSGPAGWGAKGQLRLQDILALRRPPDEAE